MTLSHSLLLFFCPEKQPVTFGILTIPRIWLYILFVGVVGSLAQSGPMKNEYFRPGGFITVRHVKKVKHEKYADCIGYCQFYKIW